MNKNSWYILIYFLTFFNSLYVQGQNNKLIYEIGLCNYERNENDSLFNVSVKFTLKNKSKKNYYLTDTSLIKRALTFGKMFDISIFLYKKENAKYRLQKLETEYGFQVISPLLAKALKAQIAHVERPRQHVDG